jgi:hypothetical protein
MDSEQQPRKIEFSLKLTSLYLYLIVFFSVVVLTSFVLYWTFLILMIIILVLLIILYNLNKEIDATLLIIYEK